MEAAAAFASIGVGGPSWEFPGKGLWFDRSIQPTHEHPATKDNLTDWVRLPRKLTKIENGCSKESPLERPIRASVLRFDEKTSTYEIKMTPKVKIRGSSLDAQALMERVSRLTRSRLGGEFIGYLEGLGDRVELSLLKREGRVQVVVDATSRGLARSLDPKLAPCEWIGKSDREACDRFLKEIELGRAPIQINKNHPQREAILQIFKEVSMRSIGVYFLLDFKALQKRVAIEYRPGMNACVAAYINGITTFIDLQAQEGILGGLSKESRKIIPIPNDPKYFVIHELIHANHCLLREFHGGPDMLQYLSGVVQYNPEKKAYECMYPDIFLKGHGDFEEQVTITWKGPYTENGFRHMFFDPLRWGHKPYELLVQDDPDELREFFVDPCGPEGVFNRVALMILRNELVYAEPILRETSDEEIATGIQQVTPLLLSAGQRRALNRVGELLDLKLCQRRLGMVPVTA